MCFLGGKRDQNLGYLTQFYVSVQLLEESFSDFTEPDRAKKKTKRTRLQEQKTKQLNQFAP